MKARYRQLCDQEESIPLFSRDWWLDAVAGDNWDVALVERGGEIAAALPYVRKSRLGFCTLTQPQLTQALGPWIRDTRASHVRRIARDKELMDELIAALPDYDHYFQHWHAGQTNWLPFYWKGFTETTRYTYRLDDLSDLDSVWSGIQQNIRAQIRKARDKQGLTVRTDLPLDAFISLNRKVFSRQQMSLPYPEQLVQSIHAAASSRAQGCTFIAEDAEGRCHAAVYLVWDKNTAYYLMGGGDPDLRNSGAASLCMWEAIRHASTVSRHFDFEGSMIEPIERFFRGFGAVQTPYHSVTHTPSRVLRLAKLVRAELGSRR